MSSGMKSFDFIKTIRNVDIFGYQVQFKYKGDQSQRQSMLGGIFSILAMYLILTHGLNGLSKVNSHDEKDSRMLQYDITLSNDMVKSINYDSTDLSVIHVIRKNYSNIFDEQDMDRHISIKFY